MSTSTKTAPKKKITKTRKTALPLPEKEMQMERKMQDLDRGMREYEKRNEEYGLWRAKLTKSYQMMLDLMQYLGPIPLVFQAYDNWFTYDLPKFLREEKIDFVSGTSSYRISLELNGIAKPMYKNSQGQVRPLMPRIAKLENHNYVAQLFVNIDLFKKIEVAQGEYQYVPEGRKEKVPFYEMPAMVNSSLCHLKEMTPEEKLMNGTDPDDPGGYFILVPTLKQTNSEPRQAKEVFFVNKDSMIKDVSSHIFIEAGSPVAKTTVSTNYGTQQITIIRDNKTNILNARVALKEKRTVNVLVVFKLLHEIIQEQKGEEEEFDLEETVNMIVSMSKEKWSTRMKIAMSATIEHFNSINNHLLYFAENLGVGNEAMRDEEVKNHIKKVVFPTSPMEHRSVELAILMVRLLEFMIGERKLDDRDHWGNKRIDTAGSLIGTLFNTLFIRVRRSIVEAMKTRVVNIDNVEKCCLESFTSHLTNEFHMAFTGANFSPSGSYRSNANYLEPMPTNGTLTTVLSLLTGVKKPTKNKVDPSVRQVKSSSFGYIDPNDSPEGKTIGIKLFMSMLATVSLNRNMDTIKDYLLGKGKDDTLKVKKVRDEVYKDKVVLNGIFMGWGRGQLMEDEFRKLKRLDLIPFDARVFYEEDENMLYLDVNSGRPIRPLLVVEDGELVMDKKNLWKEKMEVIVKSGAIEWVDPQEVKKMTVAYSIDFFRKRMGFLKAMRDQLDKVKNNAFGGDGIENYKGYFDLSSEEKKKKTIEGLEEAIAKEEFEREYHYCEIDPNSIFGYSGAVVPFANSNPVPRITLQSNMGRQAIGRTSKVQHLLYNRSAMEITPTASFEYMGIEDFTGQSSHSPNQTVFMAVMPRRENQEDATELNRSAVERGLFNFTEYFSSVISESVSNDTMKKIGAPNLAEVRKEKRKFYRNVDDRGIVRLNSIVNEGDVLVSAWKENIASRERREIPLVVRKGEGGTVDSIHITKDPSGSLTVSVKVRQERVPIVGDKFQMGAAQKGVVGAITPEVDMPFVVGGNPDMYGMKPDIIINSHAFPSRMTIGAFLEMLASLIGIKTGTAMDISAFQEELTLDKLLAALKRLNIPNKGYVQLASGTTGKILRDVQGGDQGAYMFMMPLVYRQLKHVTHNKMQARGVGSKKIDTGQPVGGRQREGATRFGRMESDVLASHGAFSFMSDRLCKSSDAFESVVCKTCGNFASVDIKNEQFACRICENEHKNKGFGRVILPYIGVNIGHQLASAGVKMKLHINDDEKIRSGMYEDVEM